MMSPTFGIETVERASQSAAIMEDHLEQKLPVSIDSNIDKNRLTSRKLGTN